MQFGDLAAAEGREWWLTNGLGGYASGTISGVASRRYHGLLIAALPAPLGRWAYLAVVLFAFSVIGYVQAQNVARAHVVGQLRRLRLRLGSGLGRRCGPAAYSW